MLEELPLPEGVPAGSAGEACSAGKAEEGLGSAAAGARGGKAIPEPNLAQPNQAQQAQPHMQGPLYVAR